PLAAFFPALVEEALAQLGRILRCTGNKKEVAHCRARVAEKSGAAVAVRVLEIRSRTTRHQQVVQRPVFHKHDALALDAFLVYLVIADERLAVELRDRGIIHKGHALWQHARADATSPFAAPAHALHELIKHRQHGERWASTAQ